MKEKIFVICIATLISIYGALGFYALPLASFEGDLTRMAPLPELQFGWKKHQPSIAPQLLKQVSLAEADVLVIGDSFSDPRIWQSVLVGNGLKVRTELWGSMPFICKDLGQKLRGLGFKGRFLVIESVERNLAHRLNDSLRCNQSHYQGQTATDSLRTPPATQIDDNKADYSSKLFVAINTFANSKIFSALHENLQIIPFLVNEEVAIRPVKQGCQLFSHAACSHALFYASENAEDNWKQSIRSIQDLNLRVADIKPIWLVIPNKSTVYLYPDKQLWSEIKRHSLGPDLLEWANEALTNGTVDLYPGNNTHLSTEGYLRVGRELAQALMTL